MKSTLNLALATLFSFASISQAVVLVSEDFSYADGSLAALNGGTGWGGAWGNLTLPTQNASGTNIVSGGQLLVGDAAGTSTATSQIFRPLATEFGTDGTSIWVTITHQRLGSKDVTGGAPQPGAGLLGGGTSYVRPVNWALFDVTSTAASSERLSFGEGTRTSNDTDTFGVLIAGASTNPATVWTNNAIDAVNVMVMRIDFGTANVDTATAWINPAPGDLALQTPSATTTGNLTFDRVRPFAGNANNQTINGVATPTQAAYGSFDNFAIATDWTDIHAIPEPTSLTLSGVALLGLLGRRRRK